VLWVLQIKALQYKDVASQKYLGMKGFRLNHEDGFKIAFLSKNSGAVTSIEVKSGQLTTTAPRSTQALNSLCSREPEFF